MATTKDRRNPVGKKLNKVYDVLLDGAANGLRDRQLYDYVTEHCPKTSAKRIVKASMFALSDPDVRDRGVLEAIYALAISYRLSSLGVEDDTHDEDDEDTHAPSVSKNLKTKLKTSASKIPPAADDPTGTLPDGAPVH
jgi:hypothetical protein